MEYFDWDDSKKNGEKWMDILNVRLTQLLINLRQLGIALKRKKLKWLKKKK